MSRQSLSKLTLLFLEAWERLTNRLGTGRQLVHTPGIGPSQSGAGQGPNSLRLRATRIEVFRCRGGRAAVCSFFEKRTERQIFTKLTWL